MKHLLAFSMRRTSEKAYVEERDAIARDWWHFLSVALPDVLPLLLPNDPRLAADLCRMDGVVGLVLTGGNDVGTCPERDDSEDAACSATLERELPVLGVCRGLQFLASRHGADLVDADPAIHRAQRHAIDTRESWCGPSREVNSYHGQQVLLPATSPFRISATSADGCVEAFRHAVLPMRGILWHPEREPVPDPADLALFREMFRSA